MPKLVIDGQEVSVPQGTTILQAAERLGIEIPHLCYHPKLPPVGLCRLCLVEVEKNPKLQASCSTPVAEGMVVHTDSERVLKARRGILEFLMLNHPPDCTICDKAGECKPQEYIFQCGIAESRFIETKRTNPPQDFGDKLVFRVDRCILCQRCVQFCREIAGMEELGVFNRGGRSVIGTFRGKPIENKYSGNLIDICPTGAITSRDFRFKSRVWNLTSVPSICPRCSNGCNIFIEFKDNKILRIRPRDNEEVNQCWICDEGRFGYHFVNSPDRLTTPMIKDGGKLSPVSWEEALGRAAKGLKRIIAASGADSLGGVGSAWCTNEDNYVFQKFLRETVQTGNIDLGKVREEKDESYPGNDFLIQPEKAPNRRGAREMGVSPEKGGRDLKDMIGEARSGKFKGLLIMGSNPAKETEAREALAKLEFLVVQDLFLTDTAKQADVVLPAVSYAEKEGSFTNFNGRVQWLNRALNPRGEAWPDWRIICGLANRMGGRLSYSNAQEILKEVAEKIPAYKAVSLENLGTEGILISNI
jgi:NADH-quinone oxidoreductase subunit G